MTKTLTVLANSIGEWDSVLKRFTTVLALDTELNINYVLKNIDSVKIPASGLQTLRVSSLANAQAIIINSNYPVNIELDGGVTNACDPMFILTSSAGSLTYSLIEIINTVAFDTTIDIAIYGNASYTPPAIALYTIPIPPPPAP